MDFKRITQQAKRMIDKRGGTDALKQDLSELKDVATSKGTVKEKAKAAADALKQPGTHEKTAAAADTVAAEAPPAKAAGTATPSADPQAPAADAPVKDPSAPS